MSFKDWQAQRSSSTTPSANNAQTPTSSGGFSEWKKKKAMGIEAPKTDYGAILNKRSAVQQQTPEMRDANKVYAEPVDKVITELSLSKKVKNVALQYMEAGVSTLKNIGTAIRSTGSAMQQPSENPSQLEQLAHPVTALIEKGINATGIKQAVAPYIEKAGQAIETTYGDTAKKISENPDYNSEMATFRNNGGKYDPEKFKDPWVYLNIVAQGVGSFVPGAVVGIATKSPAAAGAVMGLMEKGDAVDQFSQSLAKQKGVQVGELTGEDKKRIDTQANYYGAVSAVLESAFPHLLGKIIKEGGGNIITNSLKAIPFEGGTEGIQRFSQNLIGKMSGLSPDQVLSEGVLDEAIAGALTGSTIAGATSALTPSNESQAQVNQNIRTDTPDQKKAIQENTPIQEVQQSQADTTPQVEHYQRPDTKVPEFFDAIDSGDDSKIATAIDNMSKDDLEEAKTTLESVKNSEDYKTIDPEQAKTIDRNLEVITDLIDDKHDAIAKKVETILEGGVSTEEIANLHKDDIHHVEKVVEVIKEKLVEKKQELLKEKKTVSKTDTVAKKEIQKQIDEIDTSRHAIDANLNVHKTEMSKSTFDVKLDNGDTISVTHSTDFSQKDTPVDHFEFNGKATSETGFKSHYVTGGLQGKTPQEVAKIVGESFSKEVSSKKPSKKEKVTVAKNATVKPSLQVEKKSGITIKKARIEYTKDGVRAVPIDPNTGEELTESKKTATVKPIKEQNNEPTTGQKEVPNTINVPTKSDLGSSETPSGSTPRYDGESVPSQLGNGLIADRPNVSIATKKGRQAINEEVEAMLEMKEYSQNTDDYTADERALMALYSGAGGKESVGAEGAGLLNEYYTPQNVIDKMWGIAQRLMPSAETAFEPSAGIGKIISSSPSSIKTDGAEISKVSGTIANVLNPDSEISIGDFQELFFDPKTNKKKVHLKYDIVIGNPPFGVRGGFLKGKGEESSISRQEEYFIKRGLDMTNEGGYLVYVVNSGFLQTGKSKGKDAISKLGVLVEAYRLPEKSFEDTSIGTDIVVFQKNTFDPNMSRIEPRIGNIIEDMYFKYNKENILGEVGFRKNKFGKQESFVSGNLDEGLKKIQDAVIANKEKAKTKENLSEKNPTAVKKENKKRSPKVAKTIPRTESQFVTLPKKNATELTHEVSNISKSGNSKEAKMLEKIDRDLSIPNPTAEEKKILNFKYGFYFPDVSYFSGELYEKIEELEKTKEWTIREIGEARYEKQLQGLKNALPKKKTINDISFDPIDRHISDIEIVEKNGYRPKKISEAFIEYVRGGRMALNPKVSKYDIIGYMLGKNASKDTKQIMGFVKNDTRRIFNDFMRNELNAETQAIIVEKYNKEKNGYVRPNYSEFSIDVKGMSKQFRGDDFKMSQTQKDGVGFLVTKGSGIIAYGVGVGKTHTLAIATKANMDKGWTKRPLFIVPKSTVKETWINTLHEMFPGVTINNLGGLQAPIVRKLEKERGTDRTKWIQDGEMTVITHEGILRLGFTPEEFSGLTTDLTDALFSEDMSTKKRSAEVEKTKADEILGRAQKFATDIMISDLGFDHISVDEVHNFRKIFQGAKPETKDGESGGKKRFASIIGGTPSKRAQQLYLISQHIQKNNGNRNVFLASATPFENQATEIYNILSLVARDRMKAMGIFNINDFFSSYAQFEVELDRRLDGEWINREKMKNFANLQELQSLIKEFIDVQEDKTLVRPERRVITPQLQMSAKQEENLAKIQMLLNGESIAGEKGDKEEGAFLKASTYSIANSVSPYFIKEFTEGEVSMQTLVNDSPKIKYTLEAIRKFKADKKTKHFSTFVFFGKMGVEYHPALAKYFAKELGYKEEEVAYLSGKVTDDQKEKIKKDFNSGKIKVLLGGDQTKEGIDLQNNGFATINLALGWNPTQITQVEGRVWRQGNRRSIAPLIYPLVENSGDAMIYNKFEEKGGRLNDLYSYQGQMFDVGEIDPSEKKMALLTDPKDKVSLQISMNTAELENEHVFYESKSKNFMEIINTRNGLESDIKYSQRSIAEFDNMKELLPYQKERFYMTKDSLKKSEAKLERLNARAGGKSTEELQKEIDTINDKLKEISEKIANIKETAPSLLEKFTKEYREMVSNRKTMSDHMNEVQSLIDEVNERTPKEITAIKHEKISELDKEQLKNPSFARINELSNMSNNELLNSKELGYAKKILEKYKKTELSQPYADIAVFDITKKILMPDENGESTSDAYYHQSTVYANLSDKNEDVALGLLRHESTHDINHMQRGTIHDKLLVDWYNSMSEPEKVRLFKTSKYDSAEDTQYRYDKYKAYLKEKTKSESEFEYHMANEASAHAIQFNPINAFDRDLSFYNKVKMLVKRLVSLVTRDSSYKYALLRESYARFFNPESTVKIPEKVKPLYEKASDLLNDRLFDMSNGDFSRYQNAIAQSKSDNRYVNIDEFVSNEEKKVQLPKMEIRNVSIDDINFDPEVFDAIRDVENGQTSMTKLPVLLQKTNDGRYDILDGRHRIAQYMKEGKKDIFATFDERVYRQYADKEESKKSVTVKAHTRNGVDVKEHVRMLSMVEEKLFTTSGKIPSGGPMIKNGKISVADMYRKAYKDIYGVKAPALSSLPTEKIIRGVTKRSFTLGKRYATKLTKANYKAINKEIRDYVLANIHDVEKRGSLVKAIISAKNEGDTRKIIERVDEIASYEKAMKNAKKLVIDTIEERQLLKTENLRKAMKLPLIHNMNLEQLNQYAEALQQTEVGDEFLTQRMIETVRLTELKGITTVKGVRKHLDAKLGENFAKKGIKVSAMDNARWDTALAESNEFMHLLVKEKDMAFLTADAKTLIAEEEIDKLAKSSRQSTKRTFIEKLIPEDELVFKYLESNDKATLAQDMTTEQLALAEYLRIEFEKMRDYLVQNEQLKAYRQNYITHIRKDFLEKWKSDGLFGAIKNVLAQQKADEAAFEILSGETEEIIPFEKWFQFAMRREGNIDPSKNVMKAFLSYKLSFERKVALDSLIPKIMTYVHALTPSKTTDRGLVMDRSLKKFVTSWLNNTKGRKFDFGGFIKQGRVADTMILAVKSFTSILYIGFSVKLGIASNVGEQASNYIYLGAKGFAKGIARAQTKRGEKFLAKYENFVGKTPWKSLSSGASNLSDKVMGSMFYLFHSSQVRANKHFLLGAITDEEYMNGEVSTERLAQMKIDMGRWRVVDGGKSIVGNTSIGGTVTQFKTWAIVMIRTTVDNIQKIVKNKDISSRESQETIRQIMLLSTIGLITLMSFGGDDDDKSFMATLYQRAIRDALSSLSALDPTLYISVPVSVAFLVDLSATLKSIVLMEEYVTTKEGSYEEGDLKGVNKLKKMLTPSALK